MHIFVKPLTYVTAHCYYFTLNMFSCDNLAEVFYHALKNYVCLKVRMAMKFHYRKL